MNSDQITLFVLEDRPYLRESIKATFEDSGFRVLDAGDVETGWALLREQGAEVDVLLLDMHLREGPETGADLAEKAVETFSLWPPEIMIHSAYDDISYVQAAFRVGAAKYLRKVDFPRPEALVRYVRALALKRALSPGRPGLESQVSIGMEAAVGREAALWSFCTHFLGPELARCLGRLCALLVSHQGQTRCLGQGIEFPKRSQIYEAIQRELFSDVGATRPFRFAAGKEPWRLLSVEGEDLHVVRLLGVAPGPVFLPIAELKEIHLGLIILPSQGADQPAEDDLELAAAIHTNVRESLLVHLIRMQDKVAESAARQMLQFASRAFFYVGQEVSFVLDTQQGLEVGAHRSVGNVQSEVRTVAEELLSEAEALQTLESEMAAAPRAAVEVSALLRMLWSQLSSMGQVPAGGQLQVEGTAVAWGNRSHLSGALLRLLCWVAQRQLELPPEGRTPILARCQEDHLWLEVVFEDLSPRLPASVRRRLFMPFASSWVALAAKDLPGGRRLGLFLAKAMLETAEGGALLDQTDEMPGDLGHRFVVRLRRAEAVAS